MGLGLAMGYGAEGAQVGLERLLAQREAAKKMALYEQAQQQNEAFRQKQLAQQDELKRLALEEAAKRTAEMGAYQQENLRTREAIANMYERGRNERAESDRALRGELGMLADETKRASWEAMMARVQAQINAADARKGMLPGGWKQVEVKMPDGSSATTWVPLTPGSTPPVVPKPAAAGAQGEAAELDNLDRMADRIRQLYNPKFVGPVEGRLLEGSRKLGVRTPGLNEGEYGNALEMATLVQGLKNRYLKALSGAQVTPQEQQRLDKEMMGLSNADPDFLIRLDSAKKNIRELEARKLRTTPRTGLDVAQSPNTPAAPTSGMGGKSLRLSDVLNRAKQLGLSEQEAIADAESKGYTIIR